jgi:hypothetical protein
MVFFFIPIWVEWKEARRSPRFYLPPSDEKSQVPVGMESMTFHGLF